VSGAGSFGAGTGCGAGASAGSRAGASAGASGGGKTLCRNCRLRWLSCVVVITAEREHFLETLVNGADCGFSDRLAAPTLDRQSFIVREIFEVKTGLVFDPEVKEP